jgi:membrane-bound serine protease (ClpP class)
MDTLITPNAGYTILMLSILLTAMALLSPGTGILELGALSAILLTGYIVFQLPIHVWVLVLLILAIIPFYLAVWKGWHKAYLAASLIILLVGGAYLFEGNAWYPPVHPLLIIVISVLEGSCLWIATRKSMDIFKKRPVQDLENLIGMTGEAKTPVHRKGSVLVNSEIWSARSDAPIAEGKRISVLKREGLTLWVDEIKQDK